jgi:organic hydroperoxide reductase OsmC/OhrA
MTSRQHYYHVSLAWTGNESAGAVSFQNHNRDFSLSVTGKPSISGSSDPAFRGDSRRWNPEELLIASLSACHQLWYLGLCAASGIVVTAYEDEAEGVMAEEKPNGAGQFVEVILRPRVTLAQGSDQLVAEMLHQAAHEKCFISRSVNFPVTYAPLIKVAEPAVN